MIFNKVFKVEDAITLDTLGFAVGNTKRSWFFGDEQWFEPDPNKCDSNVVATSNIANAKLYTTRKEAFRQVSQGYYFKEVGYYG